MDADSRTQQSTLTRIAPLFALALLGAAPGSCGGFDAPPELPPPPSPVCADLAELACVDAAGCTLVANQRDEPCRCDPCPEGAICVCGCAPPAPSCVPTPACEGLDESACGVEQGCAPVLLGQGCACPGCVPGEPCPPCDCRPEPPTYLGCEAVDQCAFLEELDCEAASACQPHYAYPPRGIPCPEDEVCPPPSPVFVGCEAAPEPPPTCGAVCEIYCEYGNVLDEAGCPTCQCNPPPTCGPVCDIYCEYGNVLDEAGCPTCQCNPAPDQCATDADCAPEERCEHYATCAALDCPPPPPSQGVAR